MYRQIEKVNIKNFQSHENTSINLDPGVNVIVGSTDSGKSAIIRALRWVFFNEPRGTDFIRIGTDEVIVEIFYHDGYIIRRLRNKKVNGYEIEKNGTIEQYFGIGSDVPEEVKSITGIRKYRFSESNDSVMINFQNQHDGAFMLNDSPSQKAKSIGYISKVNLIDEAIRRANQKEQGARQIKKNLEEDLILNKTKLKKYDLLDDEIKKIKLIDSKLSLCNKNKEKSQHLIYIRDNFLNVKNSIEIGVNYINKFCYMDKLTHLLSNLFDLNKQYKDLFLYTSKYNSISLELNSTIKVLNKMQNINSLRNKISVITKKIESLNDRVELYSDYEDNDLELNSNIKIIDKTNNIKIARNNFSNIDYNVSRKILLEEFLKKYDLFSRELEVLNNTINKINIEKTSEIINEIIRKQNKVASFNLLFRSFLENDKDLNELEKQIFDMENAIKDKIDKYIQLISEAKLCPLCGSLIDEMHLINIKKELGYEI